jgi:NADPH2:quinone reductase
MRAAHIVTLDGPDSVEVRHVPVPLAGPGEVLVRVRAAGLSFPDALQTRGLYQIKHALPFVPGHELAGEVVDAPSSSGLVPGQRVAAFTRRDALAEYCAAPADQVFALPDQVSFERGAALPFNYLTAHVALTRRGRLAPGESVLVHGAAGGIGTASIQIAKAFGSGAVIAVVSSEAKAAAARAAGADHVVGVEGFRTAVAELGNVDIVVDPVGGDRFTDSLRCLRPEGRLLVIGFTAGDIPEPRVNRLLLTNTEIVGVSWGGYSSARPGFLSQQWDELLPHLASGVIDPPLGVVVPLDNVADALRAIEERRAIGKLIVRM